MCRVALREDQPLLRSKGLNAQLEPTGNSVLAQVLAMFRRLSST